MHWRTSSHVLWDAFQPISKRGAYFVPCLWIHFRPRGCHWLTSSLIFMDAFGRPSVPNIGGVLSSSHVPWIHLGQ